MAENKPAKKQVDVSHADLANAGGMLSMATTVTEFIVTNKLSTNIQGKNFVNVEGWQFAGGMIGVLPIVQHTENLSTSDEIKYRASVDLINIKTGQKVGAGIATCSNKENGKRSFQEYAIESMAQTRAVGKAYRLMLGWLMKAAGYEATPAEEMDFQNAQVVEQPKQPDPVKKATAEKAMQVVSEPVISMEEAFSNADTYKDLMQNEVWSDEEREAGLERLKTLSAPEVVKAIVALRKAIEKRTSKAA